MKSTEQTFGLLCAFYMGWYTENTTIGAGLKNKGINKWAKNMKDSVMLKEKWML